MKSDEFRKRVEENSYDSCDLAFNILSARGFLLERTSEAVFLSDNSHREDLLDLSKILMISNCGHIMGNEVFFDSSADMNRLWCCFEDVKSISVSCGPKKFGWKRFRYRKHGLKFPTMKLDPYVARLVKGLSSCGMITRDSCDGFEQATYMLHVNGTEDGDDILAKTFAKIVESKIKIPWIDVGIVADCNTEDMEGYWRINQYASFLYNNRQILGELKQCGFDGIRVKDMIAMNPDEIGQIYCDKLNSAMNSNEFLQRLDWRGLDERF